jgi:hypothetical protein
LVQAAGLGIAIPGYIWAAMRQIAETMPTQFSSTSQDLTRGKAWIGLHGASKHENVLVFIST